MQTGVLARQAGRKTNAWRSTGRRSNIIRGRKPKFPALDMAKNIEDPGARLRTLLGLEGAPQKGDKAGAFLWSVLSDLWTYSANRIPEISDSIVEIDRAMRLGFNWKLGPFELWDAAGVEATVARMKKEGQAGRGECRETARGRQEILVPGRSQGALRAACTSI